MNRFRNTIESLKGNRAGISPSVDRFLDEHGNEQIVQLVISRNIINPLITGTLNILSPNFKKKNNNNPVNPLRDKLSHAWGNTLEKEVSFPIFMRVGRK